MRHSILTVAGLILAAVPAGAQQRVTPMTPDIIASYDAVLPSADFIRGEAMVPMRDGTKLYTTWVMKKGTTNAPILLSRTPYDAHDATHQNVSQRGVDLLQVMDRDFFDAGYIRVYQDIRGLYRSDGEFVMNRPLTGPLNPTGIDESTDAYDTIDWLVKNMPGNNGKVGIIGSSYLGFTTLMATINPHPALKAAVPQSPMVDGWRGDDWLHNGAFRVNSLDYALDISLDKFRSGAAVPRGKGDDYDVYLKAGSIGDFARHYGLDRLPFAQKLFQNPAYTDFWSLQAVDKVLAQHPLKVPMIIEVGQWDQEDSYGGPAVYKALKPKDTTGDMVNLAIGPWRHSGANHYGYDLGELTFTGDTAQEWRAKWVRPFFDHYLRGAPKPATPTALTYATGINEWQASDRWPVGTDRAFYLGAGKTAGFAQTSAGKVDYVSDPGAPVPFIPRPVDMGDSSQWKPWLVHDQRFVDGRPDVMTFTGPVLDKAVHIMGAPKADIFMATTGTDGDVVVKLIDIYPDDIPEAASQGAKPSMAGFQLPIGIEIFRGRYVDDLAKPRALRPGTFERFRFDLPHVNHVFLPGHRIAVQVQSSLFPLYDRNPQTFVPNIYFAKQQDYRKATVSIGYGGATPSAVWLPVAP